MYYKFVIFFPICLNPITTSITSSNFYKIVTQSLT